MSDTTNQPESCAWCGEPANPEQGPVTTHGEDLYHDGCWDSQRYEGLVRATLLTANTIGDATRERVDDLLRDLYDKAIQVGDDDFGDLIGQVHLNYTGHHIRTDALPAVLRRLADTYVRDTFPPDDNASHHGTAEPLEGAPHHHTYDRALSAWMCVEENVNADSCTNPPDPYA
jgi:hypothetical protein